MLGSSSQVRVRKTKASDAEALANVFAESWRLAYDGIIPSAHLDGMIRRRNAAWWRDQIRNSDAGLTLTFQGNKIAGYATYGRSRFKGPRQAEIYELYLAPLYQGLGFGEHLFEACRHELDLRGLRGLLVWALSENEAAAQFYLNRGGDPIATITETMGTRKVEKTAYAWD